MTMQRERADDSDTPLPATERVFALDVLRGAALLGIFIMNMPGFTHSLFAPPPVDASALDRFAALARELLFAGKFNLLFGFVFGIGFTWQLDRLRAAEEARAAAAGRPADRHVPLAIYSRRLAALLAIGLGHAVLLWPGDVLVVYALLGFALLALRDASSATLVAVLAVCLVLPAIGEVARPSLFAGPNEAIAAFQYQQLTASNDAAFGHGSFIDAVAETARVFAWTVTTPLGRFSYVAFFVQMATGILAGVLVGRRWRPGMPPMSIVRLGRAQRSAIAVVVAMTAASLLAAMAFVDAGDATPPALAVFAAALGKTVGRAALAAFYALTVLRLCAAPQPGRWLKAFALAGRMPLSNYLLQTLLASFVCYGWGLGAWGKLGAFDESLIALALFVFIQLPASALWLARVRTGPIEALWRRLTYRSRREA